MGTPAQLEDTYDVIVVGGGNAALCAALSASEHGARVLIVEAAPLEARGGNSSFAGCVFRVPHSGLDQVSTVLCKAAFEDTKRCTLAAYSPEDFRRDMEHTSHGRADPSQMQVMLDKSWETVEWMTSQGVHWELILRKYYNIETQTGTIDLPPGAPIKAVKDGVGLMDDLWHAVEQTSISIMYDSPAQDLLITGNTVHGVRVRKIDSYLDLHGQVILACGGFEANPSLRRQFLGEGWDLVPVRGTRYNNGTMLMCALSHGARPAGHWGAAHASPQDYDAPLMGDIAATPIIPRYSYTYGISVNIDGQRFFDEGEEHFGLTYAKTGKKIANQPQAKAYQIFDQKTLYLLQPRYATSKRRYEADTIADLAAELEIPPGALEKTVGDFNDACPSPAHASSHGSKPNAKFDPDHKDGLCTAVSLQNQPPKSNWALPIDQGPFVAYAVTSGITFTYGGLASDTRARVLNLEGKPMPGLWCAGEIAGGLFYHNYAGGAGLVKGSVFGKIAGEEAAKRAAAAGGNTGLR